MQRIEALKEILPYVRDFQGKVFVVKIGGEACNPRHLPELAAQLSLIHHIGIKLVLVHGGGPQLDDLLEKLGIERRVIGGRRITDAATLEAAKMVYAGAINTDIVAALRAQGVKAVGLTGLDAGMILADKREPVEMEVSGDKRLVDFGEVGDVRSVDPGILRLIIGQNMLPIMSSFAGDENGRIFNVNADTIAARVAQAVDAHKLILVTNVAGIQRQPGDPTSLVSYIDVAGLEELIAEGVVSGGMLPKTSACIEAVSGGVPRAHIIDGTQPGSLLLELFVNEGCGTMVTAQVESQLLQPESRESI